MQTSCAEILGGDSDEICDWYMVSEISNIDNSEFLAEFKIGDETFRLCKAKNHKCPRCWKFNAVTDESLCPRCAKVLNVK